MADIIDAHIHFADDAPELLELLEEYDLALLNICFASRLPRRLAHAVVAVQDRCRRLGLGDSPGVLPSIFPNFSR